MLNRNLRSLHGMLSILSQSLTFIHITKYSTFYVELDIVKYISIMSTLPILFLFTGTTFIVLDFYNT